jgi:Pyridoxamine 5'-phosphate oxidase
MTALRTHRWIAQATMTAAAWLVAFTVVTTLLTLFRHQLGTLPLALRALVISGVLVALMANLVMPVLTAALGRPLRAEGQPAREHPRLDTLPDWPGRTIAVLSTIDPDPYAIPISAPQRAGDHRVLFNLRRDRGSLDRLRRRPQVAVTLLTEGDIAFTARGRARILEESMASGPEYAAVAVDVEHIDDHRQPAFTVEAGVDRRWVDEDEQRALRARVAGLRELAVEAVR